MPLKINVPKFASIIQNNYVKKLQRKEYDKGTILLVDKDTTLKCLQDTYVSSLQNIKVLMSFNSNDLKENQLYLCMKDMTLT